MSTIIEEKDLAKKFIVYSCSAGSGKTFTLTKEYLKIAFSAPANLAEGSEFRPDYFKSILAVTFTRDATNEMKDRILEYLLKISQHEIGTERPPILESILKELNQEYPESKVYTEKIICERANRIYYSILHNYSDFSVSTIDSFNQKIIQAFKKDLGLPYQFDMQLDQDELLQDAVQVIQDKAGKEGYSKLTNLLVDFASKRASEGSSWYLDHNLTAFGKNIFNEERWNIIQNLSDLTLDDFEKLRTQIRKFLATVEEGIQTLAQKAVDLIQRHQLEEGDFAYGNTTVCPYFTKLTNPKVPIFSVGVNSRLHKLFHEPNAKWYSGKASASAKQGIDTIKGALIDFYLEISNVLQKVENDYIIASELDKNIYLLSSINVIASEINQIKEEKNIVHISDVNKKIGKVIEGQPVPFLYERIGEKYHHILIDEFQDTSMMQWHNLIPLVSHTISKNLMSLVVGDPKQAIYRWRGGKADMLVYLPEIRTAEEDSLLKEEEITFKNAYKKEALDTNYRSLENVIKFNNTFFETIVAELKGIYPSLSKYYEDVTQKPTEKVQGNVSIQLLEEKNQYDKTSLDRILNTISEVKENGYNYSDMAILVRNNSHGVKIAQFLIEHKINVVSSESLLVNNSEAVQLVISLIKIVSNRDIEAEKLHFYRLLHQLRYKNTKIEGTKYLEFTLKAKTTNLAGFSEIIEKDFGLKINYNSLGLIPIYDMVEDVYDSFEFEKLEDQQIYLQRFLDIVLDFSKQKGNHLLDFLTFWEARCEKLSINSPDSSDAIQILTIHKSKGLQYPVVIMPYADWSTRPYPTEKLWLNWENELFPEVSTTIMGINQSTERTIFEPQVRAEKEATFLDAFNVLYVAMTRAEKELHIIGKKGSCSELEKIGNVSQLLNFFIHSNKLEVKEEELGLNGVEEAEPVNVQQFNFYDEKVEDDDKSEDNKKAKEKSAESENRTVDYVLGNTIHHSSKHIISLKSNEAEEFEKELSISQLLSTQRKGLLVHKAFEKLNSIADTDKVIQELTFSGVVSTQEAEGIKEKMFEVMQLDEIQEYFKENHDYEVLNERELLVKPKKTKGLSTVRTFRPDRILVKDKEVVVIDYKTGKNPQESHINQINRYGQYFLSIGYTEVKKILVYTEVPFCKIVE